ncbi:hypothetical protein D3C78_1706050 [compost metagenome]
MDLQLLELLLHPAPLFNLLIGALRDTRKLLNVALEETRCYQKHRAAHRVHFGLAVIDDQLVTLDAFPDPIQENLTRVIRKGICDFESAC